MSRHIQRHTERKHEEAAVGGREENIKGESMHRKKPKT